jgi:hypothetical protein
MKITKQTFEEFTISVATKDRKKAFDWAEQNGCLIRLSSPQMNRRGRTVSATKYLVVAYRPLNKAQEVQCE